MGLRDIWGILGPAKEDVTLAEFRGQSLAVDISGWFGKCKAAAGDYSDRTFFFRVLNLMSYGITPVFVFDSKDAIEIKEKKRGFAFYHSTLTWEELLKAMGFPVIRASGEAEKVCAQLNFSKIVHGVITDDGDAFAYGATTILKNYRANPTKHNMIHMYKMSNIAEKLGLGQKEIIASAILNHCGYCQGLQNIGMKSVMELLEEWKRNDVKDVLDRMRTWRTNPMLLSLINDQEKLRSFKKKPHCSQCSHLGSMPKHGKEGCSNCEGMKCCSTDKNPCPCEFHVLQNKVKLYSKELKVREIALKETNFPNEGVISEFLEHNDALCQGIDFTMKNPEYYRVFELLTEKLELKNETIKKYFTALVKMKLYGQGEYIKEIIPIGNVTKCREKKELCYSLKIQRFAFDTVSPAEETTYDIKLLRSVIDSKFPHLTPTDEQKPKIEQDQKPPEASTSTKNESRKTKINDYFQTVKNKSIKLE